MFRHFCQLLSKKLQKVAHLVRKHEKSSIWQKGASFQGNYHVLRFWSTFQLKVAKSGSFRQKWRKIIDLAKTSDFSSKLPRFALSVNFSAERSKSGSFRQKAPKIIDLAKSSIFSKETTMCRRFGQIFNKKLEKLAHFLKKKKKSLIWQSLATLGAYYPDSAFWSSFDQNVAKSGSFR